MNPARFRRRLLAWFDRHQRELPWRLDRDPYRVWVSEVMLQQTTVATVIPRFNKFIAAFPNLGSLAAAREHDVLREWQGLGYYRRARHLHRAAKVLCSHSNGSVASSPEVWRELPGVGRYIFGAVMSQAFGLREPIVEANSLRVLCRLFGQMDDPKSSRMQSWLWETAGDLVPRNRPGDFNQAMMELGALVCTPRQPNCGECPVQVDCAALADGIQDRIPLKMAGQKSARVIEAAVIVTRKNRVLLTRRSPDATRWAGMWEFPRGEIRPAEQIAAAATRIIRSLTGIKAEIGGEFATIRHSVTRFRIELVAFNAEYDGGKFRPGYYDRGVWLCPAQLPNYAGSTPQRKLAQLFASQHRQRRLF